MQKHNTQEAQAHDLRKVLENLDRAQTALDDYVGDIYAETDYEDTPETSHAEKACDLLDVARDVATCKKDLWVYLKVRDKYVTRTEDKCAYWEDGEKALDFGTISYAKGVQVGLLLNGYDLGEMNTRLETIENADMEEVEALAQRVEALEESDKDRSRDDFEFGQEFRALKDQFEEFKARMEARA